MGAKEELIKMGYRATDDGYWVLASGERLTEAQVRKRAEELGIFFVSKDKTRDLVQRINNQEEYLAIIKEYPYSVDDIEKRISTTRNDVEFYRCLIRDNEDRSEYFKWSPRFDEHFSEKFAELVRRVDKDIKEGQYCCY